MDLKERCPAIFNHGHPVDQMREDLKFIRSMLPSDDPLRYEAERNFYIRNHGISERQFRQMYKRTGAPSYAWDGNNPVA